jgi:hypothetical protein
MHSNPITPNIEPKVTLYKIEKVIASKLVTLNAIIIERNEVNKARYETKNRKSSCSKFFFHKTLFKPKNTMDKSKNIIF